MTTKEPRTEPALLIQHKDLVEQFLAAYPGTDRVAIAKNEKLVTLIQTGIDGKPIGMVIFSIESAARAARDLLSAAIEMT